MERKTFRPHRYIKSADEFDDEYDDNYDLAEDLDSISDDIEDLKDNIDDISEDPTDIDLNNNIANHYIAECDSCHGVFISAVMESKQNIEYVSGICPICGKETDQYLNWVVKKR